MLSAIIDKPVRADLAMTGEITLRGRVLPIGGLKEKLLAAKYAKIKEVLVPKSNKPDIKELDEEITDGLKITFVENMNEVLERHLPEMRGRKMVIKNVSLDIVCGITSKLPDTGRPEIAFAGKSNVGKSSLINGLLNRKALARTSSQPGKTQTINFYNVNDFMYLVDLPGYGYAKVPETEKAKWGKMIERYLHTSQTLKAVFLLIDIRHDPSANDKLMYDWIVNNGYNPIIIATKLDKLKRSQVQKNIKAIKDGLKLRPGSKIIPFPLRQSREKMKSGR